MRSECLHGRSVGDCRNSPSLRSSATVEKAQRNCLGHGAITGITGVEVVATVVLQAQLAHMRGVSKRFVKIDHAIKTGGFANPFVQLLTRSFARSGVGACGLIERKHGGDDDL